MPEVSVIFPVFNTSKYLPELFEEMLNQTFSDVEFIFVDDGSKDGTLEVIKRFSENNPGRFELLEDYGDSAQRIEEARELKQAAEEAEEENGT